MTEDKQAPNPRSPMGLQTVAAGIRSAEFRDIYSNNARVGVSPWDISITFALAKEIVPGTIIAEDQAVVRMSPQQFKTFAEAIMTTLQAWEEVFGEIKATSPPLSAAQTKQGIVNLKEAVFKEFSNA